MICAIVTCQSLGDFVLATGAALEDGWRGDLRPTRRVRRSCAHP